MMGGTPRLRFSGDQGRGEGTPGDRSGVWSDQIRWTWLSAQSYQVSIQLVK